MSLIQFTFKMIRALKKGKALTMMDCSFDISKHLNTNGMVFEWESLSRCVERDVNSVYQTIASSKMSID